MTNDRSKEGLLVDALNRLRSAIELLDLAKAPDHIAAHVDLGACQLEDLIEATRAAPLQPIGPAAGASATI